MNRWHMALLAIVGTAVVAVPAAASTASVGAADRPATIFVGARDGWVPSGVTVAAGATISVRAAGHAFGISPINPFTAPSDWARGSGPEGQPFNCPFIDDAEPDPCLLDNAPYQALVAKVGDDGPPFYIGDNADVTVPTAGSGLLYLGVNDNVPYFDDNGGGYAVQIR